MEILILIGVIFFLFTIYSIVDELIFKLTEIIRYKKKLKEIAEYRNKKYPCYSITNNEID